MNNHIDDFEEVDDEPDLVPYSEIKHAAVLAKSSSMKKKMASAVRHVNKFLKDSNLFEFKTFDEILPSHIDDHFLGLLAAYFGQKTTILS